MRRLSLVAIAAALLIPIDGFGAGRGGGGGGGGFVGGGGGAGGGRLSGGGGGGGIAGGFSRGIGVGASGPMIHSAPTMSAAPNLRSLPGVGGTGGITPHAYMGPHTYSSPAGHTLANQHMVSPSMISRESRIGHNLPNGLPLQHNVALQSHLNGQTAANRFAVNHNLVTRSLQGVGHASMLRNGAFASLATHNTAMRALGSTTFHGRFAGLNGKFPNGGWFWRHRHPVVAIGWYGPLFWPYAYSDFIDYTFWPYAYDVFWPYAYDDIYVGVFGPYSYEGPAPASGRRVRANRTSATAAQVCRQQVPALTGWPIQEIAHTVQPDESQQAALDDLKDAAGKALDVLQSACPNDLPSTPTGRLAAMRKRIEVMSQALGIVKPVLDRFYNSLSDEQKARFNPISPAARPATPAGVASRLPDLAQVCSGQAAKPTNTPTARIEQALHPTDVQRAALQALDEASAKAADYLKANCSADQALTPPGRVAAMEQRLNAMLEAIKIVQPALESFYGSLSDEQKARFNQLGAQQV
jgi:LTXXQ motif family protein